MVTEYRPQLSKATISPQMPHQCSAETEEELFPFETPESVYQNQLTYDTIVVKDNQFEKPISFNLIFP